MHDSRSQNPLTLVLGIAVNGFCFAVAGALGVVLVMDAPFLLASLFWPVNCDHVTSGCVVHTSIGAVSGLALYLCIVVAYFRKHGVARP